MSDDLISQKALIENLRSRKYIDIPLREGFESIFDWQPVAYDVDKVVGEIEEKLERYYYLYHDQHVDATYNEGRADGIQKAIEIVKAGGVDE